MRFIENSLNLWEQQSRNYVLCHLSDAIRQKSLANDHLSNFLTFSQQS